MAPHIDLPGPLGNIDVPPGWLPPCSATHWNDGVELVAEAPWNATAPNLGTWRFHERPYGIAADGAGGAFFLATGNETFLDAQGATTLCHVASSGLPGPRIEFESAQTVIGVLGVWPEAALVPARKRRVIVAAFGQTQWLSAAAIDAGGTWGWRRRWRRLAPGRSLTSTSGTVVGLAGESDGAGGALCAWRDERAPGAMEVQLQRIAANGVLRFGPQALGVGTIAGSRWPQPQPWIQLVATSTGGAIVVAPQATGGAFRYVATPVSGGGQVGAPQTLVAVVNDEWRARHRLRLAVPDRADGLFLAYAAASGALRLLRYTPGAGVRWDVAVAQPWDARCYDVHEDGRGGVLVGWIGAAAGRLEVRRYDANGAVTWDLGAGFSANPITVELPPLIRQVADRDAMARQVRVVPDGDGGAIVAWQDHEEIVDLGGWRRVARMRFACIDSTGQPMGATARVTSRPTAQTLPLLAPVGVHRAVVAWADDGDITVGGTDLWAQRIGCCPPVGDPPPPPPFGCEILPLPDAPPHDFAFQLPCGNEDRRFGVIALSRFARALRGVGLPGALLAHDTEAPKWVRLVLGGVPDGVEVMLTTMSGRRVAKAGRPRGTVRPPTGLRSLTFAPPARGADLLVVVSHEGVCDRDATWRFSVSASWGAGRPPAWPPTARKRPRTKSRKTLSRARRA